MFGSAFWVGFLKETLKGLNQLEPSLEVQVRVLLFFLFLYHNIHNILKITHLPWFRLKRQLEKLLQNVSSLIYGWRMLSLMRRGRWTIWSKTMRSNWSRTVSRITGILFIVVKLWRKKSADAFVPPMRILFSMVKFVIWRGSSAWLVNSSERLRTVRIVWPMRRELGRWDSFVRYISVVAGNTLKKFSSR